jgi:hypothetical protein
LLIRLVHTTHVPYLDGKNFILNLVHHISSSRQNLVAQNPNLVGSKDEKIFAFVLGLGVLETNEFLLRIFDHFQEETDEAGESSDGRAGISPKLFISAILKLYGFNNTKNSIKSALERAYLPSMIISKMQKISYRNQPLLVISWRLELRSATLLKRNYEDSTRH